MPDKIASSRYAGRRRNNTVASALSLVATAFGLGWLVLILGSLLWEGFSGLSIAVFTEMTPPPGASGGLLNPIVGSLILTILAVVIGTPIGILAGTYMAEYGRYDRLTSVVRFINDILLSAPSIVVGLFIYEIMVAPMGHFSGYAGSVALAVLVLPVVIFQFALSPYKDWQSLAWTGALIITFTVLALSISARALLPAGKQS
jgi:phosphate transport system permease protein